MGPMVDKRTVEAVRASTREADAPKEQAKPKTPKGPSPTADDDIWLEDYTEKAFIIRGDSKDVKEELKELGGKWISCRDKAKAWMFSKRHVEEVAKLLKIRPVLRAASC